MEPREPQSQETKRWVGPLLALLLLATFALRTWDASQGLNAGRYFDERFTLRNVTFLLKHGQLRPWHAFYLSLSYLPQAGVLAASQGLHELTGIEALAIYGKTADGYSPTAYLLCRMTNVAYGLLSLWLLFLIGRRIWSPEVGLLAAAVLSAFSRHVLSSVEFKPDILVILLTVLTFWWTLPAAFTPSLRRYLKVGLGIGLAVSTKYTGIAACLPIMAAALVNTQGGRRDRRQLGWLVLAGLTSIATFVALNPFLNVVFKFIPKLVHGYAAKGVTEKSDRWVVFQRQIEFLVEHHGPLTATFVALGVAGLLWRIARPAPEDTRERRLGAILVLSVLLGYSAVHSLGMTLFRGQNYLPVVPFSSLAAAWAMVELWRAAARRVPWLSRRLAVVLLWSAVGFGLLWRQTDIVYERVVPTNWAVVNRSLMKDLEPLHLRHVAYENELGPFQAGINPRRPAVSHLRSLGESDAAFLERTDVEAFPVHRLEGPAAERYRARMAALPEARVETVGSRLFRSRGEPVVVLRHPWTPEGEPLPLSLARTAGRRQLIAELPPGLPPGTVVQLVFWVPKKAAKKKFPELRLDLGGVAVPLFDTGRRLNRSFRVTARFPLTGREQRVRIPVPPGGSLEGYGLEVRRWTP